MCPGYNFCMQTWILMLFHIIVVDPRQSAQHPYFYACGSNDWGHIVFVLSVCLLSTLAFAINF